MIKELITHIDNRGFFREIVRGEFVQLSHSYKREGYFTPEFHYHRHQTDWWYVPAGVLKVVLCQLNTTVDYTRSSRLVVSAGDYQELITTGEEVIKIPPMTAHGFKVLEGPAHLIYVTDQVYNPEDEGRIELDYDWSK